MSIQIYFSSVVKNHHRPNCSKQWGKHYCLRKRRMTTDKIRTHKIRSLFNVCVFDYKSNALTTWLNWLLVLKSHLAALRIFIPLILNYSYIKEIVQNDFFQVHVQNTEFQEKKVCKGRIDPPMTTFDGL